MTLKIPHCAASSFLQHFWNYAEVAIYNLHTLLVVLMIGSVRTKMEMQFHKTRKDFAAPLLANASEIKKWQKGSSQLLTKIMLGDDMRVGKLGRLAAASWAFDKAHEDAFLPLKCLPSTSDHTWNILRKVLKVKALSAPSLLQWLSRELKSSKKLSCWLQLLQHTFRAKMTPLEL